VHPHEIGLHRNNLTGQGFSATIRRLQLADSIAKIELVDHNNKEIHVEMSHEKYKQNQFAIGDSVFAVPRFALVDLLMTALIL